MRIRGEMGFTIVEVLVVIAIMTVVTIVAVPYIRDMTRTIYYRQAAWDISTRLKTARQNAITTNRQTRVEFDIASRRFRMTQGNQPYGSLAWVEIAPWTALDQSVSLSTGAACNGNADINISFFPGGSSESADVCVRDASTGTVAFRVNVSPLNARVSIN